MKFPIFQSTEEMLTVIFLMVAVSLWVQKFKVFKYVGPALTVIIMGMILVNLRIVPGYQDVYGVIITYFIPMSISIYLLNVDLKELKKLSALFPADFSSAGKILLITTFSMLAAQIPAVGVLLWFYDDNYPVLLLRDHKQHLFASVD